MIREFPYTNLHDLNIDWILKIIKEFYEKYSNLDEAFTDMLARIEEKGLQAIADIESNKDSAIDSIRAFMTQCIQEINNVTGNEIAAINTAGNNQQLLISAEGNRVTNQLQAMINSMPANYQDALNQLQIINSVLNMTYNYPSLAQGHYDDPYETDDKTLVVDSNIVSSVLSAGCASRKLAISITNGTAVILKILWWSGWGDNAVIHQVIVPASSTEYTHVFDSTATYFSVAFAYNSSADTPLSPSDFSVDFDWKTALTEQLENTETIISTMTTPYKLGFSYGWERGGLNESTGANVVSATKNIRSNFIVARSKDIVQVPDTTTYKTTINFYTYVNGSYNFVSCLKHMSDTETASITLSENGYIKIAVGYLDDSDITDSNMTTIRGLVSVTRNSVISSVIHDDMEIGGLVSNNGANANTTVRTRYRTQGYYLVRETSLVKFTFNSDDLNTISAMFIYVFNENNELQTTYTCRNFTTSNAIRFIASGSNLYFKIQVSFSTAPSGMSGITIESDKVVEKVYNPELINSSIGCIAFNYEISPGVCSSGRLVLPPNYSLRGRKVPLIVFAHSSSSLQNWGTSPSEKYVNLFDYLAKEGYAIFECYSWSDQKTVETNTHNPICDPVNKACYIKGIQYVCSRYNIDINNTVFYCKSQGGNIGHWALVQSDFPFRAVGMMAPSTDPYMQQTGNLFYSKATRSAMIEYDDFNGTEEEISAFINNGNVSNALVQSFLAKNKEKITAMYPFAQGIQGCTSSDTLFNGGIEVLTTVPQWMLDKGLPARQSDYDYIPAIASHSEYSKHAQCPVKFWCAFDDTQTSSYGNYAVHQWLLNGGSESEFRVMPLDTGKHQSMDVVSRGALSASGTTKLGYSYTDIPLGYVELVEFFDRCITY